MTERLACANCGGIEFEEVGSVRCYFPGSMRLVDGKPVFVPGDGWKTPVETFESEYFCCTSCDVATDEPDPAKYKLADQFTATFTPQAWVNDTAIDVDAEGETSWDVTEYMLSLDEEVRSRLLEKAHTHEDHLRYNGAPKWVQNWCGPFEISVERSTQNG